MTTGHRKTSGELLLDYITQEILRPSPKTDVIESVDRFFNEDGELAEAISQSVANYVLRRLVHSIQLKINEANIDHRSQRCLETIDSFITNNTSLTIEGAKRTNLTQLIYSCIDASSKKRLSKYARSIVLEDFIGNDIRNCFMCGIEVDFHTKNEPDSATVEHRFPVEFGGESETYNFELSCCRCNGHKDNSLNYADFHFETISTKYPQEHTKFKKRLFKNPNLIAIWSRNKNKCSICDKTAQEAGQLSVSRLDENDGWHYMNIGNICNSHET